MSGFYKVPRMALEKCGLTDQLLAYNDLAARADYRTGKVIHSVKGVATKWGWSRSKARHFLGWAIPAIKDSASEKTTTTEGHPNDHGGTPNSQQTSGSPGDEQPRRDTPTTTEGPNTKKEYKKEETPLFAAGFEEFYLAYPKKRGKYDAQKAWSKLKPGAELSSKITAAVVAQSQSPDWLKENGQYVPLPATYLNGRRWEDEVVRRRKTSEMKAVW